MAFIKETGRSQNGNEYRYKYIVESYRDDDGNPTHDYLANLSDVPEEIVENIRAALNEDNTIVDTDELEIESGDSLRGGGQLALYRAWEKADLDRAFPNLSEKQISSIKAMVFSRITNPCSKRAIKEEMADTFLARSLTKNRLDEDTLYGVMDTLSDRFQDIQEQLRKTHQQNDPRLLLYDTTSTFFEGTEAEPGEYGHSKDKRWDRYQIIIGVVTNQDGLPLAVEVWKGNKNDADTIEGRIEVLRDRFGFEKVTFVSDSGTYSTENIEALEENGYDYIVSLAWRSQKKRLSGMAPAQLKLFDKQGFYQWKEKGTRYVGCESEAEKKRARNRRLSAMKTARDELDRLRETASSGSYYTKLRLYEKIQTMLKREGVADLFVVSIDPIPADADEEEKCPQKLEYDLDLIALRKRRALEGKYVLETSIPEEDGPPEQIESDYKRLQHVERGFRHIKNYLSIRPIYHRLERRIRAHVLICFLAYFLVKWMEIQLREEGEDREVERLIQRWDQLRLVKNKLSFRDFDKEEWAWTQGQRGNEIVQELKEVGWWQSMQGYKRSITDSLQGQ